MSAPSGRAGAEGIRARAAPDRPTVEPPPSLAPPRGSCRRPFGRRRGGRTRQRRVDEPAASACEAAERMGGGPQPTQRVGDRVTGEAGRTVVRVPRDEPGACSHVVPEAHSVRCPAVGGDRRPHLVARRGEYVVDGDTHLIEGTGPRRGDHDIGGREQAEEPRASRGGPQLERHALLVLVQQVVEVGVPRARSVRAGGVLDLDHPRAGEPEQMGAERARPQRRQVDHEGGGQGTVAGTWRAGDRHRSRRRGHRARRRRRAARRGPAGRARRDGRPGARGSTMRRRGRSDRGRSDGRPRTRAGRGAARRPRGAPGCRPPNRRADGAGGSGRYRRSARVGAAGRSRPAPRAARRPVRRAQPARRAPARRRHTGASGGPSASPVRSMAPHETQVAAVLGEPRLTAGLYRWAGEGL